MRLFQNVGFETAVLDLGEKPGLAGFSKACFKTNRVLKQALTAKFMFQSAARSKNESI
jgi:hypothetical protein